QRNDFLDVDPLLPPPVVPVQPCKQPPPPECRITALWLDPSSGGGNASFAVAAGHPLIHKDAAGRYVLAPTVEPARVHWTLSGRETVPSAPIEIYRRADANPLYTKTITWNGAAAQNGDTPLDRLDDHVSQRNTSDGGVVAITAANAALFPDDVLTVEHSPY